MPEDNANNNFSLARKVTAFTAACVLISNMVGVGIFGTTGYMARDIGHPGIILLLWLIGGAYAFLGVLCYSELGAAMPQAGGEYVYLRQAYGPIWGFLTGWTSFTIAFSAAIASCAHLFASHLHDLLEPMGIPDTRVITALLVVWALTAVHAAGVKAGGILQQFLTISKILAIILLLLLGFTMGKGDWNNLTATQVPETLGLSTILVSFLFVTYGYSGWNAAGYIAGEITEPQKNIPLAGIAGTICVAVLYLVINVFYFYALPVDRLAAAPVELVAQKSAISLLGAAASPWFTALLCLSILGTASAMIWIGPRVYYAMATDGVFPAFFAHTTKSTHTPARSIVLQSCWISILILIGGFEQLVIYAGFAMIVFSSLAIAAVMVLRIKQPELVRPYKVRPYPIIPILYIVLSLAIMYAAIKIRPTESLLGVVTVLAGLPLYWFWQWLISTKGDE